MYKSTPITKRAGSPLHNDLVDNDARNREKGKKSVSIDIIGKSTEEGKPGKKGKEITKKVEGDKPTSIVKPGDPGYDKWLAAVTKDPSIEDRFKDREVGTGEFEPDEPGTPDKTNYTATEIFRKDFGANVGDLENREMNRVTKKAGKDVRRGEIKQSRIADKKAKFEAKRGKDIEPGQKGYRKQQRLKAKETETARELTDFENRQKNAAKGQASGKGLDSAYRREDVAKTKGDYSDEAQLANADLERERNASLAKDAERNSASINFNTDVDQYKPTGMQNVKMRDFASEFGAKNVALSAAKMRAPMKKNYFKK